MIKLINTPPYYKIITQTKRYVALLTQEGTNNPIMVEYQNTIGKIIWTRNGIGQYIGTLTGTFTLNKVNIIATPTTATSTFITQVTYGINDIEIISYDTTWTEVDIEGAGDRDGIFITIEIYP